MPIATAPGSAGLQIDVTADLTALRKRFEQLSPAQLQRRVSIAINKTLGQMRSEVRVAMASTFDRPTRWTLDSLTILPAGQRQFSGASAPIAKTFAEGVLIFKGEYGDLRNRERVFMRTQIGGGTRGLKPFERRLRAAGVLPEGYQIVPGYAVPRDAYGNVARGEIVKVLSYLQAFNDGGFRANTPEARRQKLRQGTRRQRGFELFVVKPGATNAGKQLAPGIWRRTFTGFGATIQPWLMFVRPPSYRPRLDFEGISRRVFNRDFNANVEDAFRKV